MSELGLVVCLCKHEKRGHSARTGQCQRRRCPCVRFTEAPFERQQIPLIECTPEEVAARIYAALIARPEEPVTTPAFSGEAQLSLLP